MNHELKVHTQVFDAIIQRRKTFEFRLNDRNFREGDSVVLYEYLPNLGQYTGAKIEAKIGYVLHGPNFGVPDGYCAFSLLDIKSNIN